MVRGILVNGAKIVVNHYYNMTKIEFPAKIVHNSNNYGLFSSQIAVFGLLLKGLTQLK
jgi:hypothetical protein